MGTIMNAPFDLFDPSAGLEVFVTLLVKRWPVGNAAKKASNVHKVEVVLVVDPFAAAIVDFEAAVGGLHPWLDWREICPYYFCIGELVSDVSVENGQFLNFVLIR